MCYTVDQFLKRKDIGKCRYMLRIEENYSLACTNPIVLFEHKVTLYLVMILDLAMVFDLANLTDGVIHNLVALHFKSDQARRRFVEWALNEIAVVPDFHKRILFSDEAHFWLNGYINKQNCRIWSEANPQVYVETPLHLEKLTVWCVLWAGGILQKR
ncbi:hypothetical protein TNCV_4455311 [Trichonephila clavipes]|nr:hypothetical protein TNCV_4455311 [Trichonephila clavipes]